MWVGLRKEVNFKIISDENDDDKSIIFGGTPNTIIPTLVESTSSDVKNETSVGRKTTRVPQTIGLSKLNKSML